LRLLLTIAIPSISILMPQYCTDRATEKCRFHATLLAQ
jgi:hypothetical protein